ncbi:MAG: cytochrome P450 [Myxococcota bacterium]|nr:cytochrome P450 [Myxococcota bacterium]
MNQKSLSTALAHPRKACVPSGRLLGHLGALRNQPLPTVMAMMNRGEDLARLRVGVQSMFLLYHPEHIRTVLMDDQRRFVKTTRGYEKLRILLGNGLVTSEGDFWLRQRRIAQPAFRKKCIDGFARTMQTAADDLCERWRSAASARRPIDMVEAMNLVTLRIAGETLMSVDMTNEGRIVGDAMALVMERFNHIVAKPIPWPEYWPTVQNYRLWRAIFALRDITDGIIHTRRKSGAEVADLLGMFMSATDPETGESMNDRQLRDEVLTMLLAGHETTANALVWALYLISRHPEVAHRLHQELDEVLGQDTLSLRHLRQLTYLRQVIKETLRLYPPVWIVGRQAVCRTEIGGYDIPKGSYLMMSPYAMHRHPRYWENPEAFDPNRFASDAEEPDRFVYFPFIRGRRQCIGDRFAEMELTILLANLCRRFRFTLLPGQDIQLDPSVTLRPDRPVSMTLSVRTVR